MSDSSKWTMTLYTENIPQVPSTVTSPIFITQHRTPSWLGSLTEEAGWWAYVINFTNSGFSTSSNGWSHAMIHSVNKCSNFSWSHGPFIRLCQANHIREKQEGNILLPEPSELQKTCGYSHWWILPWIRPDCLGLAFLWPVARSAALVGASLWAESLDPHKTLRLDYYTTSSPLLYLVCLIVSRIQLQIKHEPCRARRHKGEGHKYTTTQRLDPLSLHARSVSVPLLYNPHDLLLWPNCSWTLVCLTRAHALAFAFHSTPS